MAQTKEQIEDEALTGAAIITMAAFQIVLIAALSIGSVDENQQINVTINNSKNLAQ